jgi:hypothetical protein
VREVDGAALVSSERPPPVTMRFDCPELDDEEETDDRYATCVECDATTWD